jgi:Protein of unknown function, DUF488
MEIHTIAFTKKMAEQFFTLLKNARIGRLMNVRLNNLSQLAGFAKKEDLRYFLRMICSCEDVREPLLAPTPEMLDQYKKGKGAWQAYERGFLTLMAERKIDTSAARRHDFRLAVRPSCGGQLSTQRACELTDID